MLQKPRPTFVDIDLNFGKHPGSLDVMKKTDVNAVKQSLKNLFLTNKFEHHFDPDFGIGIPSFLFELASSPVFGIVMKRKIKEQVKKYEPRATIDDLTVVDNANNGVNVEVFFHVLGNPDQQVLNLILERVR